MTSKMAVVDIAWGPDYSYLYKFNIHYSKYKSFLGYVQGNILVNKDNIDSFSDSITPNSIVFPSDQ